MKQLFFFLIMNVIPILSFAQTTFKPVQATITDSQGRFTSQSFDCPNMIVNDKGSYVLLSWGGENIPLNKDSKSPDIYVASQTSSSGITMKFAAYRSSATRKIYLVICTTTNGSQKVEIDFKP